MKKKKRRTQSQKQQASRPAPQPSASIEKAVRAIAHRVDVAAEGPAVATRAIWSRVDGWLTASDRRQLTQEALAARVANVWTSFRNGRDGIAITIGRLDGRAMDAEPEPVKIHVTRLEIEEKAPVILRVKYFAADNTYKPILKFTPEDAKYFHDRVEAQIGTFMRQAEFAKALQKAFDATGAGMVEAMPIDEIVKLERLAREAWPEQMQEVEREREDARQSQS